jgi:hypothetical protein
VFDSVVFLLLNMQNMHLPNVSFRFKVGVSFPTVFFSSVLALLNRVAHTKLCSATRFHVSVAMQM